MINKIKNTIREVPNNLLKTIVFLFQSFLGLNEKITNKLLTDKTQEKLTNLGYFRSYKRSSILFWVIVSSVFVIIIWASFSKINQVVRANGTVIPASKIQVVQSVFGGVIDQISIELSDTVKKNDILFKIDYEQSKINYEMTKLEVEEREKKIKILEDLVMSGSEAEMMLINERLMFGEARIRLVDFEKRFNSSEVKSPVDGVISQIHISTIGEVTKPGTLLAEIVPDNEELLIEARVDPKDITKVAIGQKAKIAFSAYDSAVYGMFEGEVTNIAKNTTLIDEQTAPFYKTIVKVNPSDDLADLEIQSGMVGQVSILGDKRTVISFFTSPITKLSQKAFRE
tara:strand:- start:4506 stop:5528 length:1023 start_codon:yes stop_codon:yes gene_type:complete